MSSFTRRWRREEGSDLSGAGSRLGSRSLKQVIDEAERKLKVQIGRLELALAKIADRGS